MSLPLLSHIKRKDVRRAADPHLNAERLGMGNGHLQCLWGVVQAERDIRGRAESRRQEDQTARPRN